MEHFGLKVWEFQCSGGLLDFHAAVVFLEIKIETPVDNLGCCNDKTVEFIAHAGALGISEKKHMNASGIPEGTSLSR